MYRRFLPSLRGSSYWQGILGRLSQILFSWKLYRCLWINWLRLGIEMLFILSRIFWLLSLYNLMFRQVLWPWGRKWYVAGLIQLLLWVQNLILLLKRVEASWGELHLHRERKRPGKNLVKQDLKLNLPRTKELSHLSELVHSCIEGSSKGLSWSRLTSRLGGWPWL